MSLIRDLLEKPASLSIASRFTVLQGYAYLACGALVVAWPGVVQTIFMDPSFAGHEEALVRLIGMMLAIVGWFYLFGGRSGARQFVAASVIDRLVLVPAVLVPLIIAGVFPHLLITFTILDPSLAIGAWVLLGRGE